MKHSKFIVVFINRLFKTMQALNKKEVIVVFANHTFQSVQALNKKEAIILAQAEQIKKGLGYTVQFVKDENGNII